VLEILNEPYGNWWGYDVNASDIAAYATLLQAIRTGLDNAGLNNIAILAAANDNNSGTTNWDTDLIANGAFATVQGITVHPYGDVDLSMDTSGTDTSGWGLVYYAHDLLTQAGIASGSRVYVTEDGWCTGMGGDCAPGGVSYTEAQKDQNIATVINQLATVTWLKGFWYFNLHPYGGNSFGLYGADGGMTPAWGAFQMAAENNGL
jgi:alpha-L-arabinofuranosidase